MIWDAYLGLVDWDRELHDSDLRQHDLAGHRHLRSILQRFVAGERGTFRNLAVLCSDNGVLEELYACIRTDRVHLLFIMFRNVV